MAKSRKDNKGRVLRKGETQRSCDGKYVYTYTDPEGKRRSIYSKDIMELREREEMDLCQYFGQKKSKDYAAFLSSSSSFC